MPRTVTKSRYDSDDENYTYRPQASATDDDLGVDATYSRRTVVAKSQAGARAGLGHLLNTSTKTEAKRERPVITDSDLNGKTRAEVSEKLEEERKVSKHHFHEAEVVLEEMDLTDHGHIKTMREVFALITEYLGYTAEERTKLLKEKSLRIKKSMTDQEKIERKHWRNQQPMTTTGWEMTEITAQVDGQHYTENDFHLCTDTPPLEQETLTKDGDEIIEMPVLPLWNWLREAKYVLGKRIEHHIRAISPHTDQIERYLNHIEHATKAHNEAYRLEWILRYMREKAHERAAQQRTGQHHAQQHAQHRTQHRTQHAPAPHMPPAHMFTGHSQPQPTRGKRRHRPGQPRLVPVPQYSTRTPAPSRGRGGGGGGKRRRGPGPRPGGDEMDTGGE